MSGKYLPDDVYTWGKLVKVHDVDPLEVSIVEYIHEDKTHFHPYIAKKDTNVSYNTIEQAIVGAILIRKHGFEKVFNGRYDFFACKVMDISSLLV